MNALIKIFVGSETEVFMLKTLIEEKGVPCIIKNNVQSGLLAGFGGGTMNSIELYINKSDLEKVQYIIDDFKQSKI